MQNVLNRLADGVLSRLLPGETASAEVCSPASWCHYARCTNHVFERCDVYRQPNCDTQHVVTFRSC